MSSIKKKQAA